MNPTPDHNLELPSGPPFSLSSTEQNTTNALDSSHQDQLNRLALAKAQVELTEASLKVQIAKERLKEAEQEHISSRMLNLPHRALPIKIYNDGLVWVAKYECVEGEPVVGRGESPQLALIDFDHHWLGLK